jgi:hypothetical protein
LDIVERDLVLPPPRGYLGTQPMLGILSIRALEDQAAGAGQLALVAWQVMAGGWSHATQTIERLGSTMNMSGLELLLLGHAYAATGIGEGAGFEVAQRARKLLKLPVTVHSLDASLLLGVTALPYGAERVRTLLDMLEPELLHGTDEHQAVHALLRAAAERDLARIDDAFARFAALDDQLGLAQCALLAHSCELATTKRPEALRAYLEHAVARYEADGRPEWAARTIAQALVPLVADELKAPPPDVAALLGRAAMFAAQARSHFALDAIFRTAAKHGFAASATSLGPFDPPAFVQRDASAVATPAPAPKPPKATKKSKKRATGA